jgi:hypothetical protein
MAASKLYERIGDSIAKADPNDDGLDADAPDDDETDESPGAMLIEALGATDADPAKVDEALRKAVRLLK